ncbi:hypothetical protein Y032_0394g628 [Ancylostoma ceylanicum]|uniref:Uncharacterized protein n=1 Tax=Ancylostoma ceylanicum TaxID=53326 RepID=A0A016RRZ0_9BILA|nr:hypothetical protein Y032_0394g628 [Ancylostoma ceylanicum]
MSTTIATPTNWRAATSTRRGRVLCLLGRFGHLRGAGEATLNNHNTRPRRVDVAAHQFARVATVIGVPLRLVSASGTLYAITATYGESQPQLHLPRTGAPHHLSGAGGATLDIHSAEPCRIGGAARQSARDAIVVDVLCTLSSVR